MELSFNVIGWSVDAVIVHVQTKLFAYVPCTIIPDHNVVDGVHVQVPEQVTVGGAQVFTTGTTPRTMTASTRLFRKCKRVSREKYDNRPAARMALPALMFTLSNIIAHAFFFK